MTERRFDDMYEYGRTDLAATHRSTAGTQTAVPAERLEAAMRDLERDGFVIFERVIGEDEVEAIRRDVVPRLSHGKGRNNFEGFATQRLYAVIEKTLSCNPLVEHPLVLGL